MLQYIIIIEIVQ